MLQPNFTPFPVLTTERLVLRQITAADANELFFLRSDETVMKYIDKARAQSVDEALRHLDVVNEALAKNDSISWAITLKDDPLMLGYIGYWRMSKENYRSEVGYVLHPAHHCKGIMSEAFAAVIDYGFGVMKLHSMEAVINPENVASQKLLEKHHFVREGYFREDYFYDGKFLDSAIYSLITPLK